MPRTAAAQERVLQALRQLGITRSEAKIYLALLRRHPATGYEVARSCHVPRAAIYHALHRLEAAGLIVAVQKKPARYAPLDTERLLGLMEERLQGSLAELRANLKRFSTPAPTVRTFSISGYDGMLEHARALISGCQGSVHLSLWRREAEALSGHLRRAREAGREVVLFSFNPLPDGLGEVFSYNIPEAELERHWPHKIILVVDRQKALVGGAQESGDNQVLFSEDTALVEMAISNLVLDITLYGQRFHKDTSRVMAGLTSYLAPVEELART